MRRVVVLQSDYLPWQGYFDLLHDADVCVLYDDVQYTRNDWRNRNQVYLQERKAWLTVPVRHPALGTAVQDVLIDGRTRWQAKHARTLRQGYARAPYYQEVSSLLRPFLDDGGQAASFERLSPLNQGLLRAVAGYLGIRVEWVDAAQLGLQGRSTERVLQAVQKVGGTEYLSGPRGADYLDASAFERVGLRLAYKDYRGYPARPQFSPVFDPQVSVVDLLFHCGPRSGEQIWGWRS